MNTFLRRILRGCAAFLLIAGATAQGELFYASTGTTIAQFDSSNPGTISSVPITGLQGGEAIIGIDRRPANGLIYGIGTSNRLYTINPTTGAATPVGAAGGFTLNGNNFGMDFNPVPDRIRLVSDNEQNIRINPNDGTLVAPADTNLSPAGNVVAAAYTNNFNGATLTTLFGIDSTSGNLVMIGGPNGTPSPNGGVVTVVGSLNLGTNLLPQIGFDISGTSGIAFALISTVVAQAKGFVDGVVATQTRLYTINLSSGQATLVGTLGNGSTLYSGLTAATAIPEPTSVMLIGAATVLLGLVYRARRVKS